MNLPATLQEIARLRNQIDLLEAEIGRTLPQELAGLPSSFGFDSVDSFVNAVRLACRKKSKRRGRPPTSALTRSTAAFSKKASQNRPKRRGKISDELKADLKKRVESGETGAAIAKALKISLASVHNVKKELGLIRG